MFAVFLHPALRVRNPQGQCVSSLLTPPVGPCSPVLHMRCSSPYAEPGEARFKEQDLACLPNHLTYVLSLHMKKVKKQMSVLPLAVEGTVCFSVFPFSADVACTYQPARAQLAYSIYFLI